MVDEAAAHCGQGPVNFLGRKFGGARAQCAAAEIKKQNPGRMPGPHYAMENIAPEIKERKGSFAQAKSAPTKQDLAAQEKAEGKKSWKIMLSKRQWLNDLSELSISARVVRLEMEFYADEAAKCFVAIRTMAKDLGCGKNTVDRALRELIEKKNVRIIGKHGRANLYLLERFKKY